MNPSAPPKLQGGLDGPHPPTHQQGTWGGYFLNVNSLTYPWSTPFYALALGGHLSPQRTKSLCRISDTYLLLLPFCSNSLPLTVHLPTLSSANLTSRILAWLPPRYPGYTYLCFFTLPTGSLPRILRLAGSPFSGSLWVPD